MGICCSKATDKSNMMEITLAEKMLDALTLNKKIPKPQVSVQGTNPLTFKDVKLSDSSSDIDEILFAEITKPDAELKNDSRKQ